MQTHIQREKERETWEIVAANRSSGVGPFEVGPRLSSPTTKMQSICDVLLGGFYTVSRIHPQHASATTAHDSQEWTVPSPGVEKKNKVSE